MLTNKKDIDAWCKAMHISEYVIYDDLSIKVFQDVDISNKKLTSIPVKFLETTGNFKCYNNNLTTLKNVPDIVGATFDCSFNKLVSLEHSPKIVKINFNCSYNQIKSLKHITPNIGESLKISSNPIVKLDYCPSIGYSFLCDNCNLIGFECFPHTILGTLNCNNNKIISFDNCPVNIGLHFYFEDNPTFSFKNAPKKMGGIFTFGFIKMKTKDLYKNQLVTDFDLLHMQIGQGLTHITNDENKLIPGFERFYFWGNNNAKLELTQEQINSFRLNSKLNNDLTEPNSNKQKKTHKI